jgi:hypothetical protein
MTSPNIVILSEAKDLLFAAAATLESSVHNGVFSEEQWATIL